MILVIGGSGFVGSFLIKEIRDLKINNLDKNPSPFYNDLTQIGDIKNKNQLDKVTLSKALLSLLDYNQQKLLDDIAPEHFIGPTGRRCPIRYSAEQAPIVSMPMQELYGMSVTPNVGDKQHKSAISLIIELLSPAKRPIQVTQDLVAFWQGSYKDVQKEMKAKYPKHFWPDDPANAQATNRVKKYM